MCIRDRCCRRPSVIINRRKRPQKTCTQLLMCPMLLIEASRPWAICIVGAAHQASARNETTRAAGGHIAST
eukprot:2818758-Amphidinium_carterae.1